MITACLFILGSLSGCGLQRGAATFVNGLPYDGCTWEVIIDDTTYGPDAASRKRIENFTGSKIGSTAAFITYDVTGETTTIECGWGALRTVPEVAIYSIEAREDSPE